MSRPIVTVFRSRLRDGVNETYGPMAELMERRARAMPGFIDLKSFIAADGERVSVITFESRSAHDAWRDDPEHRAAQQRGADEWYESYAIQVCELVDERAFSSP
ncbi:MAG: antibiotic biosynthesis monooxygenase [Acidimicrobiia bacterium]